MERESHQCFLKNSMSAHGSSFGTHSATCPLQVGDDNHVKRSDGMKVKTRLQAGGFMWKDAT